MMELSSKEALDKFDDSVDSATHDVMAKFDWMSLPKGKQLCNLMTSVYDAIAAIMIGVLQTTNKEETVNYMNDHNLLLAIQELLDGTVWNSDTTNIIIAELLNANGYTVRDKNDAARRVSPSFEVVER